MGLGGGIEAGKAYVKFLLDDKQLDSGLAKVGRSMTKFGSIGLAATLPLILAFAGFAMSAANVGSQLNDMSARTGLSVESLSELKFAAEQSGTSLEAIEVAAKSLQKQGLDPRDFDKYADGVAAIEDPVKRAQAAMKVFGKKAGTNLLPLLDTLQETRAQARALGLTLSTEDAKAADDLGDAIDVAKAQIVALGVNIGLAIAGPLTEFLKWTQGILAGVIEFVREHPRLVAAFAAITLGIAIASAALVVFGTIMTIITAHPIIAFLALLAGLIVGIATYFGFANSGAADFKKQLDGIKSPGGVELSTTATQTQSALGSVNIRPGRGVSSAAGERAASIAGAGMGEVVKWTKETAERVGDLVRIAKQGPGGWLVGSG